ncbi:hypothetical protein U472_10455 [Orenia metallireducens]|uniref:Uncharacterized protein n=1 Tax=Orenia metallireducens TaxID=1413210 RepID=A0A1C0A829_9FIRM|nr:hypothetical protein [Orenia metallireducens]OCL26415.1 hypothetical protein U472_10455 [Orenia metallireducens]
MDFTTLVDVTIELFNMDNRQLGELQDFLHNLIGNKLRKEVKFLMDEKLVKNKKVELDLSDQETDIVDLTEDNYIANLTKVDNLTEQVRQILEDNEIMNKIDIENIIEEKLNNPAITDELKELKIEVKALKEELLNQQESIIEIALKKIQKENPLKGGEENMADEKVILQQIDCECPGCPEGCPDEIGDLELCQELETIEFCCTLVIPDGFSAPVEPLTVANVAEYIEENFDLAAYFDEDCFECTPLECRINTTFGDIAVTEILIKGCIKFIGGICVASDSAPETGSQAPVCCEGTICVPEPTAVCFGGVDASCENLRVVDVDNVEATRVGLSCGDAVWNVTGELVFACGPCVANS